MKKEDILKKIIKIIEKEKKWIMLENKLLNKLEIYIGDKDKSKTKLCANACSRTLKREHKFEEELISLLDKLKKLDPALEEQIAKIVKMADKASQKGILKKNTAARKKSRLVHKFNAAFKTASNEPVEQE